MVFAFTVTVACYTAIGHQISRFNATRKLFYCCKNVRYICHLEKQTCQNGKQKKQKGSCPVTKVF